MTQRRAVFDRYREAFADLPGFEPMPEAPFGLHTRWLSCFLVDGERTQAEIPDWEKDRISHRGQACRRAAAFLEGLP